MKLLFLNVDNWNGNIIYFILLYPILVVIPAGFSYAEDYETKNIVNVVARVGKKNYYAGKTIAVMATTFGVFTLPFLLEIILNCISFPLEATGNLSYYSIYDFEYNHELSNYFWLDLYLGWPYLYAVVCILFLGLVSAVLSVLVLAVSTFKIKYKVFLFLPVYILLFLFDNVTNIFGELSFSTSYQSYLLLYTYAPKNYAVCFAVLGAISAFSLFAIYYHAKKDVLI
ncbi:hypothetical protein LQZ18_18375 [Lachnospiraceae bacterium ZAX-1]